MRYVIMVSHGTLAPGIHNALGMMVGNDRDNVRNTSMLDGMGAEEYKQNVAALVENITPEDEIILMADLAEGSPMTNALAVLDQKGLLSNTVAFAGMNLPMAVTAVMMDESTPLEETKNEILQEAHEQLHVMEIDLNGDAPEEI